MWCVYVSGSQPFKVKGRYCQILLLIIIMDLRSVSASKDVNGDPKSNGKSWRANDIRF